MLLHRFFLVASLIGGIAHPSPAHALGSRIKDLVMIGGARDNQLSGLGLVVGLAGEGDKNPVYTLQSMSSLFQRYGISVPAATLSAKNVAVVMVTADIRAFVKEGTRMDVTISSLGDAKTLQGGVLLQCPLYGPPPDHKVYAVAQGAIALGGFLGGSGGAGGATIQKNHPTVAKIPGGALVELEIPATIVRNNSLDLLLREPDFTSAARMAVAINEIFTGRAQAIDPMTVRIRIPDGMEASPVDFIARVESIEVNPDTPARVIVNERTGTIVATSRIRISPCAVSHGELTITVASSLDVSQPNPLSQTGNTTVTPRTDTKVNEPKSALLVLPEMPTIEKVAAGLNAIGVTPRDMMAIFQTMKEAGALQAELIMR